MYGGSAQNESGSFCLFRTFHTFYRRKIEDNLERLQQRPDGHQFLTVLKELSFVSFLEEIPIMWIPASSVAHMNSIMRRLGRDKSDTAGLDTIEGGAQLVPVSAKSISVRCFSASPCPSEI